MRPLAASRLPRYRELQVRVSSNGTIRVQNNTYSVPPRLRGERLIVRLFDLHLEVYYGDSRQLVLERLRGEGKHQIDYRHVIWSLVKKPWALARYRYREALFPTLLRRRAYEALVEKLPERQADLDYCGCCIFPPRLRSTRSRQPWSCCSTKASFRPSPR